MILTVEAEDKRVLAVEVEAYQVNGLINLAELESYIDSEKKLIDASIILEEGGKGVILLGDVGNAASYSLKLNVKSFNSEKYGINWKIRKRTDLLESVTSNMKDGDYNEQEVAKDVIFMVQIDEDSLIFVMKTFATTEKQAKEYFSKKEAH